MVGKAMQDAMNEQINKELFSSYRYLSMTAHLETMNLPGFAHWMRIQEAEEREHAMKFFDFIIETGGEVSLKAIDAPKKTWGSLLELAEEVAAHEGKVTASINALYELAMKEKDYPAQVMLQWFISEQAGERLALFKAGAWALGLPIIILGGIYTGFFTATEAAAGAVVYAVFVEMVVYRALDFRRLVDYRGVERRHRIGHLLLLAMGALLSHFVVLSGVPDIARELVKTLNMNWMTFLMFVNVLMLVAGMFIDPNSILLLLVPTLYPVALALGIDPIHFGMVVVLNITIGMITPPFGLDLG